MFSDLLKQLHQQSPTSRDFTMATSTKFMFFALLSVSLIIGCSAQRKNNHKGEMYGDWCSKYYSAFNQLTQVRQCISLDGFPEDNCILSRPNYQLKQVPCVWCYARELCMESLDRCTR